MTPAGKRLGFSSAATDYILHGDHHRLTPQTEVPIIFFSFSWILKPEKNLNSKVTGTTERVSLKLLAFKNRSWQTVPSELGCTYQKPSGFPSAYPTCNPPIRCDPGEAPQFCRQRLLSSDNKQTKHSMMKMSTTGNRPN